MSNVGFMYFKKANKNNETAYLEAAHWLRFSLAEDP